MILRLLFIRLLFLAVFMGAPLLRGEDAGLDALRAQAEKGDATAQNNLGVRYDHGEGVTTDHPEAVKWYWMAANQGLAVSQYNLGIMYYFGRGISKDITEAVKWLQLAANQGNVDAQRFLGDTYYLGDNLPKDLVEAVKWYRMAADQGDILAQKVLGSYYMNAYKVGQRSGRGGGRRGGVSAPLPLDADKQKEITGDLTEALKWYRMAADQDDADAQFILADYYVFESDVPNLVEAAKWYRKLANKGYVNAQDGLGTVYDKMEDTPENQVEAVKWYRMAADHGDEDAQDSLGAHYLSGSGVPKDVTEALKWYRMAADQGDAFEQVKLAELYENGGRDQMAVLNEDPKLMPVDLIEAAKWYRKAAMQNDHVSLYKLGLMYRDGRGVPKDKVEALAYFIVTDADRVSGLVSDEDKKQLEQDLGPERVLLAQQRSQAILKEIALLEEQRMQEMLKKAGLSPKEDKPKATPSFSPTTQAVYKGSGSGAIVTANGYVLTAAHVVKNATMINVMTIQGLKPAIAVKIDAVNDVAVLKISEGTYAPLPIRESQLVRLGQTVSTIGFPKPDIQGFSPKFTKGDISSLNGFRDEANEWQISVPIQPGNSGGALLDENGNLIGVVVSHLNPSTDKATGVINGQIPENVNYAKKSAYALALLKPYLDASAPKPNLTGPAPKSEDMVEKVEPSIVLILVY